MRPMLGSQGYEILCAAINKTKELCGDVIRNELNCFWASGRTKGNFYVSNDTRLSDGKNVSEHMNAVVATSNKDLLKRILEFELMLEHVNSFMTKYVDSINNILGMDNDKMSVIMLIVLLIGWMWYDMDEWMKLSGNDSNLNTKLLEILKADNGLNKHIIHRFHAFMKACDALCNCKQCLLSKDRMTVQSDEYDLAQEIDANSCVFAQLKLKELLGDESNKLPPLLEVLYKNIGSPNACCINSALWHIAALQYLICPNELSTDDLFAAARTDNSPQAMKLYTKHTLVRHGVSVRSDNSPQAMKLRTDTNSFIVSVCRSITPAISSNLVNDGSRLEYVVVNIQHNDGYKIENSYVLYSVSADAPYNIVSISYSLDELISKLNAYTGAACASTRDKIISGSSVEKCCIKKYFLHCALLLNAILIIICIAKYNSLSERSSEQFVSRRFYSHNTGIRY